VEKIERNEIGPRWPCAKYGKHQTEFCEISRKANNRSTAKIKGMELGKFIK
jgi:hypothetical protein